MKKILVGLVLLFASFLCAQSESLNNLNSDDLASAVQISDNEIKIKLSENNFFVFKHNFNTYQDYANNFGIYTQIQYDFNNVDWAFYTSEDGSITNRSNLNFDPMVRILFYAHYYHLDRGLNLLNDRINFDSYHDSEVDLARSKHSNGDYSKSELDEELRKIESSREYTRDFVESWNNNVVNRIKHNLLFFAKQLVSQINETKIFNSNIISSTMRTNKDVNMEVTDGNTKMPYINDLITKEQIELLDAYLKGFHKQRRHFDIPILY